MPTAARTDAPFLEKHHPFGYEGENALKIEYVCHKCPTERPTLADQETTRKHYGPRKPRIRKDGTTQPFGWAEIGTQADKEQAGKS